MGTVFKNKKMDKLYADIEPHQFDPETLQNYSFPQDNSTVERWIKFNSPTPWTTEDKLKIASMIALSHCGMYSWAYLVGVGDSIKLRRNRLTPFAKYWGIRAVPFAAFIYISHWFRTTT